MKIIAFSFFFSAIFSTEKERTSSFVVLYSSNLALIQEVREIPFPGGKTIVYVEDLPETLDPSSFQIQPFKGNAVRIFSYRFEKQLVESQALLDQFVGKEILIAVREKEEETVKPARLLSASGIVEMEGRVHLQPPGRIILPQLPEGYLLKPRLVVEVEAEAQKIPVSIGYLAANMDWKAEYLLNYSESKQEGSFAGTIEIRNQTRWKLENATTLLVAGEVHRVAEAFAMAREMKAEMGLMAAPPPVAERPFFEYHLYHLPSPASFLPLASQFVPFFSVQKILVKKKYQTVAQEHMFTSRNPEPTPMDIGVFLEWKNEKENNLGIPIPAGKIRVFQEWDSEGKPILIGEDNVPHTPEGELLRIRTGSAFDIRAERVQTDFKRISSRLHEVAFELVFRNHRKEEIVIEALEPISGDWEILESNFAPHKVSARWVKFLIPVEPAGEKTLRYRVQVKY